jgi:hypothetical protein
MFMLIALGLVSFAWAKAPEGFRGVKLGMQKPDVLRALEKNRGFSSYDDRGELVGEIIRGDEMFRHATYRFDSDGVLVEIVLDMREILGKDRILELYKSQYGVDLLSGGSSVEDGRVYEVKGNRLFMRSQSDKGALAGKGAH